MDNSQDKVNLSALSLFVATPAQTKASHKRTWTQWNDGLTEEQYIKRETLVGEMEHAANSRLITWVLVPRDNPTTLDFVSSCETFRRRGLVVYSRPNGNRNEPQEVTCYGIASVYVRPSERGNGYASHMMRLLHWVLSGRTAEYNLPEFPAEWGAPPPEVESAGKGLFSVLYSDIGEEFYKKSGPALTETGGWEVRDYISTVWEVPPQPSNLETDGSWTWLKQKDLDRLWAMDVEHIKRNIAAMPTSGSSTLVTFLPDQGVGFFQVIRTAFEGLVSMDSWGVEKNDGNIDQPTYATWSVDRLVHPRKLLVTRIMATESTFPGLVEKIQRAARESGIRKVEAWNLPESLTGVAEQLGGTTFERDEHLPTIKWYGKGDTTDIKWVFNERFCWC